MLAGLLSRRQPPLNYGALFGAAPFDFCAVPMIVFVG